MSNAISHKVSFSGVGVLILLIILIIVSFFGNGIYLLLCFATLGAILGILWKFHRPGIVVFAFVLQWLQVIAYVIWMDIRGKPMDFLSNNAPFALLASCVGLFIMASVISIGINKLPIYSSEEFVKQANLVNKRKILGLYLFSTLFFSSIGFVFGNTSGLAQVLVTVSLLKWIFFIWYGIIVWVSKKNRVILILILAYEFTTGLYSYFSSFKEVLFYTIIVSLTFIKQITFRQFMNFLVIAISLLIIFVTWTAIKGGYRQFLNQGTRQQSVNVSKSEAFSKIGENLQNISWKQYQLSMNVALYRIQYVYHLAIVMDRIPAVMPHENGRLWWENVSFVFTPRILFPEKSIYEPTKKTNKYTGFKYSGLQKGAAFSLGYFADSYVDFGYIGMFLPLISLALFVSFIYRTFYNMNQLNLFFRFAIINVTLYNFISFEADGLFLFGRLLTNLLVFWVFSKTIFPAIQKWLYD